MKKVRSELLALHEELRSSLTPQQSSLLDQLIISKPAQQGCRGFENVGSVVVGLLKQAASITHLDVRRDFSRALIARLAADAVAEIQVRAVTPEVIERSRRWQSVLLEFLRGRDQGDYWYPNDLFLKDYRFVTGITVPCGAQVIDLVDGIGPKTACKIAIRWPRFFLRALTKPWFQIHTESRYLDEFNDRGWTEFYHTAVGLLKINPRIEGIVGTSWFYDPALMKVSPRLYYLQEYPLNNGAILIEQGTTAFDIKSATATSATRKTLYEEGKYQPRCHTLMWPREEMISWDATSKTGGPSPMASPSA